MTGEEIRDIGYLKWKDPLAWMEKMSGKQWGKLLQKEKKIFNELSKKTESLARQMEKELEEVKQYITQLGYSIACNTIDIYLDRGSLFYWKWKWNKELKRAHDLDYQGNTIWYVTSSEDEIYNNKLICETADNKVIWKKDTVSTQLAVKDELCYFIKVQNYFRTTELCVCNAHTGNQEKVIYREDDKQRELILVKASNKTLYLKSYDANNTKLWKINGTELLPLYINSSHQIPLGKSIYNDDCVLTKQTITTKWETHGEPLTKWKLPNFDQEEPIWINIQSGHILTINEGTMTIWYSERTLQKILSVKVGTITPNPWSNWENTLYQIFCVKTPDEPPYILYLLKDKIIQIQRPTIKDPIHFKPLEIHKYTTKSRDGTEVPYIIIKEKTSKLLGQIIFVYGAYGSQTQIGWLQQQWYPLLKRGVAIVYALVRGGGDKTLEWASTARKENRIRTIEDYEAVIKASQQKNKLSSEQTILYGRSAGGISIGAAIARNPTGKLFRAVYAESPYVDILRTSTNEELPLTIGEYEEFGNPRKELLHFATLLKISPIDSLPAEGAPNIFIIDRVGLKDKQVFAYESFKWIQKLRGNNTYCNKIITQPYMKYITFEESEGHHYSSKGFIKAKATDLAILFAWLKSDLF